MTALRHLLLCVMVFIVLLFPGPARSEIRLLGDWTYLWSSSEMEEKGSDAIRDSEAEGFKQLYRFDLRKPLSPTLMLSGGALAEHDRMTSEAGRGDEIEITSQTVRPYIDAEFNNRLYRLAAGYRESEVKTTLSGQETDRFFVEEFDLRGDWRPTDLPSLEGAYVHTERHDDPLSFERESDLYRLSSRYLWKEYDFTYNYLRSEEAQKLRNSETLIQTHNGRVRYVRTLMDNRISLNMRAQMERTEVEFSGGADRITPTVPRGTGFYILQDLTPENNLSVRPDNPREEIVLVPPGSFTAVNLASGHAEPVSMGLSFGTPARADRVRIFLRTAPDDPTIASPAEIEEVFRSFHWRVFVSKDRETWTERTMRGVSYDQVENYFEIRFSPALDREYLKVTTTPLDPLALPGGEDIVVRDLQAFYTLPEEEGDQIVTLSRIFNAGVGWAISERTRLGYDLAYQDLEVEGFDQENRRLTNGVNLSHRFNAVFTGLSRFLRSDEWQQGDHDTVAYSYSAQLVARYLPTLNQSLTYSGSHAEEPEGTSWSNAFYLRTNAELYRGWNASLDAGYTWQEDEVQETSSFFLRFQNSIVPHRSLSIIADYSARWVEQETRGNYVEHIGRLRGSWSPTDAFSLMGEISARDTELGSFTEWLFGANWLPLRDGTLQANLSYSEQNDSYDQWRRSLSPSLTWRISRKIVARLTYSLGQLEDPRRTADFHTVLANLRIYYQ